jgi:lipid-A-disaccharide synthase-like uncharacterized protein
MVVNWFQIIPILGLILIMFGGIFSLKKKTRVKYTYSLYIFGGICLLFYSIHINDLIFIILQGVFIILAIVEYSVAHKR